MLSAVSSIDGIGQGHGLNGHHVNAGAKADVLLNRSGDFGHGLVPFGSVVFTPVSEMTAFLSAKVKSSATVAGHDGQDQGVEQDAGEVLCRNEATGPGSNSVQL